MGPAISVIGQNSGWEEGVLVLVEVKVVLVVMVVVRLVVTTKLRVEDEEMSIVVDY
jgi:hypothetical protein